MAKVRVIPLVGEVLVSAIGRRQFPHIGLADGDEIDLGGPRLRVLATPEHVALLLLDSSGDDLAGELSGDFPAWAAAGRPLMTGAGP